MSWRKYVKILCLYNNDTKQKQNIDSRIFVFRAKYSLHYADNFPGWLIMNFKKLFTHLILTVTPTFLQLHKTFQYPTDG